MQKQLGLRMREKRAAMLAENYINIPSKEEEDEDDDDVEVDEDSMDTTEESNDDDIQSEIISNVDQENVSRKRVT